MRKLIYSLVIPITVGVIGALILLKQFPALLHPTVTLMTENHSESVQPSGPVSYASAVDKAAPAVVNIYSTTIVKQPIRVNSLPPKQVLSVGNNPPAKANPQLGLGSGVIVSPDGHLLTNYHVVADATEIIVALHDGRAAKARIVGIDPDTDLAVLKIDLPNLPTITLAASDNVHVGDVALAIGNPLGKGQTVTMGIISATGRYNLGLNTYEDFIQTDAAINLGNSGGALIDAMGNLIGINTAIQSDSQGIGYAIPSKLASSVLQEIIIHGSVTRGWLGVSVESYTKFQLAQKGVQLNQDVLKVTDVAADGPAAKAGVQIDDLILAINDQSAENGYAILNLIAQSAPSSKSIITILRNGKILQLEAEIARKPITTN